MRSICAGELAIIRCCPFLEYRINSSLTERL
jgi:hypothetical protein